MCCDKLNPYTYQDQDGECPKCGTPTVKGEAIDRCGYSSIECNTCKSQPCDMSC